MSEDTRTIKATCLCGSAKHEVTLPVSAFPLKQELCEFVPPKDYRPAQELVDKLQPFRFSDRYTQYFCPTCGTHMLAHVGEHDDYTKVHWDIATGTLEEAEGVFELDAHEFIEDTVDGGFSDFLTTVHGKQVKRWARQPEKSEQLPLYWQSPSRPDLQPDPSERLHAHCKCGGVEFWIARPSERSALGRAPWPDVLIPYTFKGELPPQDEAWWLPAGGTKYLAGLCACDSCRLACGVEWVEWAFIPTVDIILDAEGKIPFPADRKFGTMKHYQSRDDVKRHFCGSCGATVFWDGDERPVVIDVAVGLLDAPEGARAESWLQWRTARVSFREDAMPRAESLTLAVEEGLKRYAERYQGGPVNKEGWAGGC